MTQVHAWTMTALAVVVLAAGILLASGAVSFAQEGSPTATPEATEPAATPEPTDDATGDETPSPTPSTPSDDGSTEDAEEDRNCPEKEAGEDAATETTEA